MNLINQRRYDMNGRFQMQGGKNWILPKEINANRFFWVSHWLEIWSNHLCPSTGPNLREPSWLWLIQRTTRTFMTSCSSAIKSGRTGDQRPMSCPPLPQQLYLGDILWPVATAMAPTLSRKQTSHTKSSHHQSPTTAQPGATGTGTATAGVSTTPTWGSSLGMQDRLHKVHIPV